MFCSVSNDAISWDDKPYFDTALRAIRSLLLFRRTQYTAPCAPFPRGYRTEKSWRQNDLGFTRVPLDEQDDGEDDVLKSDER